MRALVIGASGLVGGALIPALGTGAIGTYRTRPRPGLTHLDASDAEAVRKLIASTDPTVIFFPAAEANVDWCEQHPIAARERNVTPLLRILDASEGRRVIGFSSDYVFDGSGGPYTESDPVRPISVYGALKVEIERELLDRGHSVMRTTTVFGWEATPAENFVLRLVASLRARTAVTVASDQVSTPTFANDLATAAVRVASAGRGIWHVAGPDRMSRADLAYRVAEVFELERGLIHAVRTTDLAQAARRPLDAGLRCNRYGREFGQPARDTTSALRALRAQMENAPADR